ncbi:tRNA uridine-5-carboxymethylaminomethyl(34) synthesis enzyme MnmG [Bdellovibrio svalbardensis]|uniref:tRNA uridine 5-carboxymethylaminomethyl modification enzyme MnmG n=1 Tax=Bdellovibrio svalbardensis TaxID=2972972 RepID=A0ABT6DEM4_9BACT|nr:tRNA uridine-5-carboxymethylaminomethyl(34) synthesis enzyme MnmG [Bdellovibrio svalbardensis]MDG0814937.1 tRNA uridine-5-carboxymethylaminomethyl(34) synthesis enzyme MnmG [Bdellovibrio svalbardensis]
MTNKKFDVIVVGAGHAGIEACLSAARLGVQTLMITTNTDRIGYMSCNPSIGGLAKGHMVRELDVLGGQMGIAADETTIQYKRLNSSKGPAVRGTRVQNDKHLYSQFQKDALYNQPNLSVLQGEVKRLILENDLCVGVVLQDGSEIFAKATIITTGTFMNGVMHIGLRQEAGGRVGDKPSIGLSDQLAQFGFEVKRLKTGTPARLHKDSIDWSKTIPQGGDEKVYPFSYRSSTQLKLPQILCYLTRTTELTHDIIRGNLDKSPMYCGIIEGVGPRYCPSIEDKVTRFADRVSHQTFLEPEGLNTDLIYLQGISTSLPEETQDQFLKTIPGLENVKVVRYGYAVEYDYIEPTQIWHRLETRTIRQLFLAGQINGTSGYEEAAGQGLIAGINAAHSILGREEFILGRDEAYMGVLIDDLVTKGTREPYRMFTSRAEHRLVLREDNTIDRLADIAARIGIVSTESLDILSSLRSRRQDLHEKMRSTKIYPTKDVQELLAKIPSAEMTKSLSFEELLRRPEISSSHLEIFNFTVDPDPNVTEPVEIEVKYSGYIKRQMDLIEQSKRLEELVLPEALSYAEIRGLSNEEKDKLQRVKPRTLGQAQRISGVNPSAIQAIMIHLKGHKKLKEISVDGQQRTAGADDILARG